MKIVEEAYEFLLKRSFFQHHSNLPSVYIYILCLPLNVKMLPPVLVPWIFYVFFKFGGTQEIKLFPINLHLGGGNSNMFYFHPLVGEDSQFDIYFSDGLLQPPTWIVSRKRIWRNGPLLIWRHVMWLTWRWRRQPCVPTLLKISLLEATPKRESISLSTSILSRAKKLLVFWWSSFNLPLSKLPTPPRTKGENIRGVIEPPACP